MAVIKKLLLIIIFSNFIKNEVAGEKTNFSELVCENDGCERRENNVALQRRTSIANNGFYTGANDQTETENVLYTDHLPAAINFEDVNKTIEADLNYTTSVAEITEFYEELNNSKTGESNIKASFISPLNSKPLIKNNITTNGKPQSQNVTYLSSDIAHSGNMFEITTRSAPSNKMNSTHVQSNSTIFFPVGKDVSSRNFQNKNTDICPCNLKVDECDINCCCDEDCTSNMKQIFSYCMDLKDMSTDKADNFCLSSESMFKHNVKDIQVENGHGLFCLVKNNLKFYLPFNEGQIIKNVTHFQKRITGKKLFTYSAAHIEEPKMSNASYKIGDYLWTISKNRPVPFGVPQYHVHRQCNSVQNVRFLTEYSTNCLYSVPGNRKSCEKASQLEMDFFLKSGNVVKSPSFIKKANSSDFVQVCSNETCAEITAYICPENSEISSCVKASPRRLLWDKDICKNIVSSVEYRFFHNGTEGIKEVRAYFSLVNLTSNRDSYVLQKIKLKYFWAKMPEQVFIRSGNPGYIIGKPIMAGKKIFSNNETSTQKKEAIDLSLNPEHWLSVAGNKNGICTFDKRDALNFGENVVKTCFVSLSEFDFAKGKCVDLQETIFQFLIGHDYADVKSSNRFNKYVATFGNSRVEETGDWVQIIIDMLPIVSSQVSVIRLDEIIICKNMVTDLFIDIAHSKIGSFKNPQNKILGVQFYFGSPKNIIYSKDYNSASIKSTKMVKISTFVHFIDLTTQPEAEFAETPGFEAKFPHDFFYPFFSACSPSIHSDAFIVFILMLLCFYN